MRSVAKRGNLYIIYTIFFEIMALQIEVHVKIRKTFL